MKELRVDYFNFRHGGLKGATYLGGGDRRDLSGLVRVMEPGPWPNVLVIGEAVRWEDEGGAAANEACAALHRAGGPPYVAQVGSLPRSAGPFGPAILYNPRRFLRRRWWDQRAPDFSARYRNLLVLSRLDDTTTFGVVAVHGDIHSGDARLADAHVVARLGDPGFPVVIAGDWNSTPSGPMWDVGAFGDPLHQTRMHKTNHKILFEHGPAQAGPHRADTRALDLLCGWWDSARDCRVGGVGFVDAAEAAGVTAPTQLPHPSGRAPRAVDRILVNRPWARAITDFTVHPPLPDHPSDHLRIGVTMLTPAGASPRLGVEAGR